MKYYKLLKPLIFSLDEETAHNLSIKALRAGIVPNQPLLSTPILQQNLFGLTFRNPIGLAAGYDKNGSAIMPLLKQGFGFIETGTVTPLAQDGNPKPRIFRLKEDEAIINRMGFNNKGADNYVKNLTNALTRKSGIVGANIGKNKEAPNTPQDYLTMMEHVYGLSDYITINISSPNTPNLRALQKKDALAELLSALAAKKQQLIESTGKTIPLLLKMAPDVDDDDCKAIADLCLEYRIDGLIVSNTTIGLRDELKNQQRAHEQGGLSGRPLLKLSTNVLAKMYRRTEGKLPLVAAGGVRTAEDAYEKICNGASLVQIYSALIYQGFEMTTDINKELLNIVKKDGFTNISQAIGKNIDI